jgi:hypothetical protein
MNYIVINTHTLRTACACYSFTVARRRADKLNLEYGANRYTVEAI